MQTSLLYPLVIIVSLSAPLMACGSTEGNADGSTGGAGGNVDPGSGGQTGGNGAGAQASGGQSTGGQGSGGQAPDGGATSTGGGDGSGGSGPTTGFQGTWLQSDTVISGDCVGLDPEPDQELIITSQGIEDPDANCDIPLTFDGNTAVLTQPTECGNSLFSASYDSFTLNLLPNGTIDISLYFVLTNNLGSTPQTCSATLTALLTRKGD